MEAGTLEREKQETEPQEPDETSGQDDGQGDEQQPDSSLEELHVEGDEGYLTTDAGGKAPTDSKLQIVGRSVAIEGQYKKGARIMALVELEVGNVGFRDKHDSATGQVVACTRQHDARIVGFTKR